MPRISETAEIERRNNLIAVAESLFLANGYDNTTINHIVENLGLAKGTFYYHFKSKEAILVAVSEKLLGDTQRELQSIYDCKVENVFIRLKGMLTVINEDVYRNERIWKFVYQDNNVSLYYQLIKTCMEKFRPLLAGVLEEGSAEGVLDVPHATEMAEVLLTLLDLYAKQICGENDRSRRVRIHFTMKHVLERMLDGRCVPDFGILAPECARTA